VAAAAEGTLVLASPHEAPKDAHGGLLARQLVRQSVLLAAREQFGVATRDVELRQTFAPTTKIVPRQIEVWSEVRPGDGLTVEIQRSRGVAGDKLLATKKPLSGEPVLDYVALAERCQELSQNEFPAVLVQLGWVATQAKPAEIGGAKVSAQIERQLERMTFLSQFSAIRFLHAAVRREGQSPDALGALVRGYANLAVLAERQLDASPKVYAARALLYAQRLVTQSPTTASAYWHRGYALALAGLHKPARDDFAKAARLAAATPQTAPAWAPLVDALCRFDQAALAVEKAPSNLRETVRLLRLVAVERAILAPADYDYPHTAQAAEAAAVEIISQLPDCERAQQAPLTTFSDVPPRPIFTPQWYRALSDLADAPAKVRQAAAAAAHPVMPADRRDRATNLAAERRHRRAVLAALHDASVSDDEELPWSVLAAWIEDQSFLEAWREAAMANHSLLAADSDQSGDDVKTTLLPLLSRHPLIKFVEARLADAEPRRAELSAAAWRSIDKASLHARHRILAEDLADEPSKDIAVELEATIARHFDDVYGDLVDALRGEATEPSLAIWAKRLHAVSPDAPLAAVAMIKHVWPQSADKAAGWERQHAAHVEVQAALAERHLAARRFDDARRCLTRYIRLSPDEFGYTRLAATYQAQGNTELWLSTLEEYLRQRGDDAAGAGNVQVSIARHFVQSGELSRALPYAEQAAEGGSHEGFLMAAECHEYAKNWPLAEKFYRQADDRADAPTSAHWLRFCIRTGYGGVNAARSKSAQAISEITRTDPAESLAAAGYIHLLLGQPRHAMTWLRRSVDKGNDPVAALHLCLLALDEKQPAVAQAAIKRALEATRTKEPHLAELTRRLEGVVRGSKSKFDESALEKRTLPSSAAARADALYFAGRIFEVQGDKSGSRAAFRQSAACATSSLSRTLACAALRAAGEEPNDIRFESGR
jgi:tetratricopeptide (TPR) repeat protein